MAKQIYISNDDVEAILKEVREQILGAKSFGSIDIKRNFAKDKRTAAIFFTPDAWNKLTALVREFDTEVEWHGRVNRISESEFEIYDIIVPPHVVTGSTVTADYTKYSEWLNALEDDVFNSLHFHGHSHVNMACSPSGTDMKYRQDVVTQLPVPKNETDDSFYIFCIFNKRGEWTGEIYDLKYNALYETGDIEVDVYTDDDGYLSEFIAEAKKVAVKETPKSATAYGGGYAGGYSGSYSSYGSGYGGYSGYDADKKKGKGKKKKGGGQQSIFGRNGWDDDDDDLYSKGYCYGSVKEL